MDEESVLLSKSSLLTTLATIFERFQGEEDLELEFKLARGGLPKSIWPTVSAFANTEGGWIVLGIAEEPSSFIIEGILNAPELLQDFHNLLRNEQKISHAICGPRDTFIEEVDGKQIIVIRVPAAPRSVRPIYVSGNVYAGTYVRRNSGDYRCTKQEVDRMMREASNRTADSAILPHVTWHDIDDEALARYRRRFQTHSSGSPWNGYDTDRFLQAIGGYRRDVETSEEGITVAGLLLLGTPEALRHWRARHLIDYRLLPTNMSLEARWDDRLIR